MDSYFEYLRTYSQELGSRIVEMYPPVQGPSDSIAKQIGSLLRKPLPAQALTITGLAKHLKTAHSVRIVGECGTSKTLMSIGVAHTHADGAPYSTIAMWPPHMVLKWAREVLIAVPRARAFVIYDLRNRGDPTRPHGVVEVQLRKGQPVLDLGNNAASGQYVLGQPLNRVNRRKADRLRTVSELYPEIADPSAGEDDLPSCSAIEALDRQEPFINQTLAASALAMLSRRFRYGKLSDHDGFFNAQTGRMSALPIDPRMWAKTRRRSGRWMPELQVG